MFRESNKYRALFFTRFVGEYLFYSLLSLYLEKVRGFSGTKIGTLLSLIPLILSFAIPIWALAEESKIKPYILMISSLLIIGFQFLIVLSQSFVALVIMVILYAMVRAPFSPTLDSLTTHYCKQTKQEAISFRLFGSVGYICAVMLGSLLFDYINFEYITAISSITFVCFSILSTTVKPVFHKEQDKLEKPKKNLKLLFKNYNYMIFLIAQILCFSTMNLNTTYESLYLKSRDISTHYLGYLTLVRVSTEILTMLFLIKNKINYKYIFLAMPCFMLGQSLIFFFKAPVYALFLADILSGIGSGLILYSNFKYMMRIVRINNITVATYILIFVQNISMAVLIFLGGYIKDHFSISKVYLLTAILFAIAIVFIAVFFKPLARNITKKENIKTQN